MFTTFQYFLRSKSNTNIEYFLINDNYVYIVFEKINKDLKNLNFSIFTIWTCSYYFTILANTLKLVFAIRTPCDSSLVTWLKIFVKIIRDGFDSFWLNTKAFRNIKRHRYRFGLAKWIISFAYVVKCLWNTNVIHSQYIDLKFLTLNVLLNRLKNKKNKGEIREIELNID